MPPPSSPPGPPTSDDLISQALASGQIDWPTSLLYRMWAQWGDPQLPADLVGAGPSEEDDLGIGIDPFLFRKDIPDAVYAQMQPYLVRPTDRGSAFSTASAAVPTVSNSAFRAAVAGPAEDPSTAFEDCGPTAPWASQHGTLPYKVWASCTGDYQSVIASAAQAMNDIWGPETQLMGSPLPDDGSGGDSAIDVYLVNGTSQCPPGRDTCETLSASAAGMAVPTDVAPNTQKPSMAESGYILIPRAVAADPAYLKFELIHELFHVLEYAHNIDALATETTLYWQVEADAKWAQAWLGSQPAQGITSLIRPKVYLPYFDFKFQTRDIPLNQPNSDADHAAYRSFIWPFFAQQQTAGPQFMGQIWGALQGASSFAAADQASDRIFPFTDQFPEFALRNLNMQLEPNDPIQPRYKDLDGTFPDNGPPWGDRHKSAIEVGVLPVGQTQDIPEKLAPLTSHYRNATIDSDVRAVEVDFTKMSGGTIRADAMVDVNNPDGSTTWERRTLAPGRTTWCLDDPGNAFNDFLLIVSNASFNAADTSTGTFSITGRDRCAEVHGNLTWTYHMTSYGGQTEDATVWLDVKLKPLPLSSDNYIDDGSSFTFMGYWQMPNRPAESQYVCGQYNEYHSLGGTGTNGPGSPGAYLGLSVIQSDGYALLQGSVQGKEHDHSEDVGPADCASVYDNDTQGGYSLWCQPLTAQDAQVRGTPSVDGKSIDMSCQDTRVQDLGGGAQKVETVTVSGTLYITPTTPPSDAP